MKEMIGKRDKFSGGSEKTFVRPTSRTQFIFLHWDAEFLYTGALPYGYTSIRGYRLNLTRWSIKWKMALWSNELLMLNELQCILHRLLQWLRLLIIWLRNRILSRTYRRCLNFLACFCSRVSVLYGTDGEIISMFFS